MSHKPGRILIKPRADAWMRGGRLTHTQHTAITAHGEESLRQEQARGDTNVSARKLSSFFKNIRAALIHVRAPRLATQCLQVLLRLVRTAVTVLGLTLIQDKPHFLDSEEIWLSFQISETVTGRWITLQMKSASITEPGAINHVCPFPGLSRAPSLWHGDNSLVLPCQGPTCLMFMNNLHGSEGWKSREPALGYGPLWGVGLLCFFFLRESYILGYETSSHIWVHLTVFSPTWGDMYVNPRWWFFKNVSKNSWCSSL